MKPTSCKFIVLSLALAGCGTSALDQEEQARLEAENNKLYTIRFKRWGDVNNNVEVRNTTSDKRFIQNADANGKLVSKKITTRGTEDVYTETVLETGERNPPKFKRKYSKARVEEEGKGFQRTYKGRTILYLLQDTGHYEVVPVGGELADPDDLPYAQVAADPPDYFSAPHPVKVGDAWPVDPGQKLAAGANLDRKKSSGQAALTKVYERDGKTYGVINVKLVMVFDNTTMDIDLQYDGVIDGTSTAATRTSTAHFFNEIKHQDGTSTLTTSDSTTTQVSFEEVPPKTRPLPPDKEMPKEKDKDKEMAKDKEKDKEKDKDKEKE